MGFEERKMIPIEGFESGAAQRARERERLLQRRIADLNLKLEGTRVEQIIQRLHRELETAGITFKPHVYLSDEWGCPEAVPIIGIPFYLADEGLTRIEDEMREGVEAESDEEILRYLRHEAGHAFNYAYKLFETDEWHELFGPYSRPYADEYTPNPFSHNFVRHLPGWYAQKHPDDDFAETFAVWLTPHSNWKEIYKDWGCYPKLLYVDEMVKKFGRREPLVTAEGYDTSEVSLHSSLADHYERLRDPAIEIPPYFDSALRDVFDALPASAEPGADRPKAAQFVQSHRRSIVTAVVYWTGLSDSAVRALLRHMVDRCEQLDLRVGADDRAALVELVVLMTTLCMNKLYKGEFVSK